jgi:hypothetical protein
LCAGMPGACSSSMTRIAVLVLLLGGCNIDIIDCIDLGQGCGPPAISLTRPLLADNETSEGVAIGGLYTLTVHGGIGDVTVDGADHVTVASITAVTVDVCGRSEGQDKLEIRQDESLAVDWVRVLPLAGVALVPRELAFVRLAAPPPYTLHAGSEAELVVRLLGADGARLIDQSLTVEGEGGTVEPTRWDAFRVISDTGLVVDVIAAGRAFGLTVPVATAIQDIVPVSGGDVADIRAVTEGRLALVCFAAVAAGLHVAGLSWQIEGIGVSVPNHGSLAPGGCVHVANPADGQTLLVRAGGLERTFTLLLR